MKLLFTKKQTPQKVISFRKGDAAIYCSLWLNLGDPLAF